MALLGLAYKRDIADCRESPALVIREKLRRAGANVLSYDPFYTKENSHPSLKATLNADDTVVIATDHTVFKQLTPKILERYGINVLIDGRNCLSKEEFVSSPVTYLGIGR